MIKIKNLLKQINYKQLRKEFEELYKKEVYKIYDNVFENESRIYIPYKQIHQLKFPKDVESAYSFFIKLFKSVNLKIDKQH